MLVATHDEGLALIGVVVLLADGTVDVYFAPHERGFAFGTTSIVLAGHAHTHVYILIKEKALRKIVSLSYRTEDTSGKGVIKGTA